MSTRRSLWVRNHMNSEETNENRAGTTTAVPRGLARRPSRFPKQLQRVRLNQRCQLEERWDLESLDETLHTQADT
jgi:hypothetical protein